MTQSLPRTGTASAPTPSSPAAPTPRRAPVVDRPGVRPMVGLLTVAVALGAWEVAGRTEAVPFLVPLTDAVSEAWSILTGPRLRADVLPSAVRALLGFVLGSAVGVAVGLPLGYWRSLDPWARPVLEFFRATPLPAVLPVAFIAFGASDGTRVGLIAAGVVWPVLLNATDGARAVDRTMLDAARAAGLGRTRMLRTVVLRASMPQIFAGLRIALGLALVVMVVSEMIASDSGLGFLILSSQRTYALTQMYGGVFLLGALGALFTIAFTLIERRALRWYAGQKGLSGA